MVRCILHADLDAFFVSVERVLNPSLRGKPVVVGGEPNGRGVVACASYEARAFGLHAGMPLTTAYRLCPDAIFLTGHFSHYRDASEKFMRILSDYSPQMESLGIDEAYLDLTGTEGLFGTPHQVARRIKERIKAELSITASIGIGSSKLVAKVASDLSKPDGLVEVAPGEERAFLAPLPVAVLPGVGRQTERVLKGMGVTTIGELAALLLPLLTDTFGVVGEALHRHARGIDRSPVEPPAPAQSISRSTTFPEDTADRPFLRAMLRYLTERVCAELRQEGKRARCVTLTLRYADFETITRSLTLREVTDADQVIFEAGLNLLEKALSHMRERLRLIGVGVSGFVGEWQLNMLDSSSLRLERLNRVIDCLRNRYGFTSIQVGRTLLLRHFFPSEERGYLLKTPCLSR